MEIPKEYKFEQSDEPEYKYKVIFKNKNNHRYTTVYFGKNINTNHYRDTTGLNIYSHLDNNNECHRLNWLKILSFKTCRRGIYSKIHYNNYEEFWEARFLYNYEDQ